MTTRIITDACQDKNGYMWFSTYLGISKYDGFSFTNYDTATGLPDQQYRKIRCDEKGIIWAIPYFSIGKIVCLDGNTLKSIQIPTAKDAHSYNTSFDVAYMNNGPVICIGTYNGIDIYKNNKWTHLNISPEKVNNIVYGVTAKNGSFYLSTKIGVCILHGESLTWDLNKKINAKNETILAVKFENPETPNQRMWILTNHSIGYYQNNILTVLNEAFFLDDVDVANFPYLAVANSNEILFGNNFSKYILKISERKIIPLHLKSGFSSNGASSIFVDSERNIWITDSRGVDKINNISIANYFESSGMPANEVTAIVETRDGRLVLGHNNLISILNNNSFETIKFPGNQNSLTRILDMTNVSDGNIWFSANSLGVGRLSPQKAIRWYPAAEQNLTTSVCQDNSGRIWVGTNHKLFYIKDGKMVKYEHNNQLQGGVRKMFASYQGGIYVCNSMGLWHVENERATVVPTTEKRNQLNVFSYYRDNKGTEFIGTMGGLYNIKNGSITRYNHEHLQINNPIYFILQDKGHNYWFGTNNGVYKWNGINDPEVYNTFNGLAGRETNRSAGLCDSKGRVWVGTDRGLSCFSPGNEHLKTPAPTVILLFTETIHGNKYLLNEPCSVSNIDNTLNFHFRGISFINEDLITYKYRLEGYDKNWREATQSMLEKITYTDLKPGKYRLCVLAKNYSSKWGEKVYSSEIVIRPPFYLTWWFITLSLLLFISLLWVFNMLFTQKLINKTLKKEIADRKQAENSLKESEQRLSFVLEGSRLGTWDWDIKTNLIQRNHLWAEMLGFSNLEIEPSPQQWLNLIHPADKEKAWADLQHHLEGKIPTFEIAYRMRTKNNQYRWILDRAMIVQWDDAGKPLRMSGTQSDITDRKLSEEALQKSEERLRLLLASLPVAIYISPLNSDNDLEMITGNVKNLTGFTDEEYLSKPDFWRSRLHPDDYLRILEAYKQAPEQGGITTEYRWQLADGSYKWFHDQAILKTNGLRQEYMGVIVDINDRKQAEQEIKNKNEQLNLTNAEKDKLFSIISHDLRSPVSGFLGLTTLMNEELEELDTAQIREIVSALNNSASKVNDLLNDLLEWSLLQRGLTLFTPTTIHLHKIITECTDMLSEQVKAKNIILINDVPIETRIVADVHMLQVVLRNLLSNAVKFTPKGGQVLVSAVAEQGQYTRISISDTGIGMNADLKARLFIVNEKTSRKGTEGEPSSGLGLILCREFVEKQNGKIWVESEEGKGSRFNFSVPF